MENIHPIKAAALRNKNGEHSGVYSVCSANEWVLRAAARHAKKYHYTLIIESTSNQVNQFGGYTGLLPQEFAKMAMKITDQEGLPQEQLVLGGDHLGPLVWQNEPESIAMKKAEEMVESYVLAGYTKIHIDTSMRLGDDDHNRALDTEIAARRGAHLAKIAMNAFAKRKIEVPNSVRPVLVIGSEVPIPGGSIEHENFVAPTDANEFKRQVSVFRAEFAKNGLSFDDVVAFVVQPGVEFGDDFVFLYDRGNASQLIAALKEYPNIVFEGHSTDYQTQEKLTELVQDGVAILKVGPALTFALREALFLMEEIEKVIIEDESMRSHFKETLLNSMNCDDRYWKKYYVGTKEEIEFKKFYSYSDRCRYYLPVKEVTEAADKLFQLGTISPALISQYFPKQYEKVMKGELKSDAKSLILDRIGDQMDVYSAACGQK